MESDADAVLAWLASGDPVAVLFGIIVGVTLPLLLLEWARRAARQVMM